MAAIGGSLERLVKKDKLTADARSAALARVTGTTDYALLAAADLVIEAATENLELKLKILQTGRRDRRRRTRSSRPTRRRSRSRTLAAVDAAARARSSACISSIRCR